MDLIRQFKPAYWLYNLFSYSRLKYIRKLYKKYGLKKFYFSSINSSDFANRKTEFQQDVSDLEIDDAKTWLEEGCIVRRKLLSEEWVDKINAEIDELNTSGQAHWRYNDRIEFAFEKCPSIAQLVRYKPLQDLLSELVQSKIWLFQSLNFIEGTEQRTHSDAIHLTTYPLGKLIVAWVALEDIELDQGPVHYYPGSHKLPYVLNPEFGNQGSLFFLGNKEYSDYEDYIEQIVVTNNLQKKVFTAKKGDVIIWHANMLHGGEVQTNKNKTRKSMVLHFFAEDAICYHEIRERPCLRRKLATL